jgi:hypothetical protein
MGNLIIKPNTGGTLNLQDEGGTDAIAIDTSGGVSGSAILDEDAMGSNSATQLATQQSIKAYVDSAGTNSSITTLGTVTSGNLSNTAIVYPAGHVSNVFRFHITGGSEYSNASTTPKISQTPLSFSAVSGRHYTISTSVSCWPYKDSTNTNNTIQETHLYWGTTSRSQGDTSLDTVIDKHRVGHYEAANTTTALNAYFAASFTGNFTAASTATHYVYIVQYATASHTVSRTQATSGAPWNTIIYEVMP